MVDKGSKQSVCLLVVDYPPFPRSGDGAGTSEMQNGDYGDDEDDDGEDKNDEEGKEYCFCVGSLLYFDMFLDISDGLLCRILFWYIYVF